MEAFRTIVTIVGSKGLSLNLDFMDQSQSYNSVKLTPKFEALFLLELRFKLCLEVIMGLAVLESIVNSS